jgi:hypothetical protein
VEHQRRAAVKFEPKGAVAGFTRLLRRHREYRSPSKA